MLAIGILFYLVAYLTVGGLVTLYLRFVGLPAPDHHHDGDCYPNIEKYLASNRGAYDYNRHAKTICKPRLGGKPFEIVLWLLYTAGWPLVVVGIAFATLVWLIGRGLWIKL